jgi:predicted acetyltransferase
VKTLKIELTKATIDEKPLIKNMLELYSHDFSEFLNFDLDENGLYGYSSLDAYWAESEHHPYIVRISDKLAGFVLVKNRGSQEDPLYSIAEFFIIRKYRGKGLGRQVATTIFDMFLGRWTIRQVEKNYLAQAFWRSVISDYTKGNFSERYENRNSVQEFTS